MVRKHHPFPTLVAANAIVAAHARRATSELRCCFGSRARASMRSKTAGASASTNAAAVRASAAANAWIAWQPAWGHTCVGFY